MPRVKVVWSNQISLDDYNSLAVLACGGTEWDELTDDEITILRNNLHFLRRPEGQYSYQAHLLIDDGISTRDYLQQAIEGRDKHLAERKRAERVYEANQKKKALTARERRKAQYEKMKREFEES